MTSTGDATIRIERTIPAPSHQVYRGWLDPDLVRRWMAPGDQEVTRVEIDERAGGAWRTWKSDAGTVVGGFDSELLELVPDRRIVFRRGFIGPQRREGPSYDTLLTVTLREAPGDATELSLVHEGLDQLATEMPHIASNVGAGWDAVLQKLSALVARVDGIGTRVALTGAVPDLLEGPNYAHLATLLPDGSPHSIPVWVGIEHDRLAFLTSPASRKARNIERDRRVSISVTDKDDPFVMAQIRGQVTGRLDGEEAWRVIDGISTKYTGGPYPQRTDRVVFLVEPQHVAGTAYR